MHQYTLRGYESQDVQARALRTHNRRNSPNQMETQKFHRLECRSRDLALHGSIFRDGPKSYLALKVLAQKVQAKIRRLLSLGLSTRFARRCLKC